MKFEKIVVALDSETKSKNPLFRQAVDLAVKDGAGLVMVNCFKMATVAEMENRVGTVGELESKDAFSTQAHRQEVEIAHRKAWLESMAKTAMDKGLEVQIMVEMGNPGERICEVAKQTKADLIAIGRTTRGSLADCILGSVSNYVVHNSPCSVLLLFES